MLQQCSIHFHIANLKSKAWHSTPNLNRRCRLLLECSSSASPQSLVQLILSMRRHPGVLFRQPSPGRKPPYRTWRGCNQHNPNISYIRIFSRPWKVSSRLGINELQYI